MFAHRTSTLRQIKPENSIARNECETVGLIYHVTISNDYSVTSEVFARKYDLIYTLSTTQNDQNMAFQLQVDNEHALKYA